VLSESERDMAGERGGAGSAWRALGVLGRDIKLSHSVFAMPFALLGAFLAAGGAPRWGELGLIVACMFFARTFAMLANRYVDRALDAVNPRTAGRALPRGAVGAGTVRAAMALSGAGLAGGAAGFGLAYGNWWPVAGTPVVLAWLGGYGLAKRYTSGAHFVLGGALALSPLAAAAAVEPAYLGEGSAWLLAGFVLLWVAGFDVIYAIQDIDVDRAQGLRSIPARLGERGALLAAKGCHFGALGLLVAVYRTTPPLGAGTVGLGEGTSWFLLALVVVGLLLMAEHNAASRGRFTMAFFTLNGVIGVVVGAAGIADVMLAGRG